MLPAVNSDVSTRYESKETNAKRSFIIKKCRSSKSICLFLLPRYTIRICEGGIMYDAVLTSWSFWELFEWLLIGS